MTEEEERSFNTYGCGCRCLIKLSEIHKKPITKAAFLERFLPKYGNLWGAQIGGSITSTLIDIGRDLGICTHADTRTDPRKIREIASGACTGILVITDREVSSDGSTHPLYHCRLFRGIRDDGCWALWEPYQNGDERDAVCYPDEYLQVCLAQFLVFYRVEPTSASS
jgi:hypothetical protein